jgi:hypothetical protein
MFRIRRKRPSPVKRLTLFAHFLQTNLRLASRIKCLKGRMMNLFEVAKEISDRLTRIFLRDERGRRPVYGGHGEIPG